jgi:hypothetical protein
MKSARDTTSIRRAAACSLILVLAQAGRAAAHSGPPYPIVSKRASGAYVVSVWADPDATDDRTPAGRFWVTIEPVAQAAPLPAATRARVTARPLDRVASAGAQTAPIDGDTGRQFAAVLMDHEGRYGVHVAVEGPLGPGAVDAEVDATYDLRPSPIMLLVYLMPFLLIGFVWGKLLLKRRGHGTSDRRTPA